MSNIFVYFNFRENLLQVVVYCLVSGLIICVGIKPGIDTGVPGHDGLPGHLDLVLSLIINCWLIVNNLSKLETR